MKDVGNPQSMRSEAVGLQMTVQFPPLELPRTASCKVGDTLIAWQERREHSLLEVWNLDQSEFLP